MYFSVASPALLPPAAAVRRAGPALAVTAHAAARVAVAAGAAASPRLATHGDNNTPPPAAAAAQPAASASSAQSRGHSGCAASAAASQPLASACLFPIAAPPTAPVMAGASVSAAAAGLAGVVPAVFAAAARAAEAVVPPAAAAAAGYLALRSSCRFATFDTSSFASHRHEQQQSSSSSSSSKAARGRRSAAARDQYDPPLRAARAAEERHLWRGEGGRSSSWSPYFFPQPGRVDTRPQLQQQHTPHAADGAAAAAAAPTVQRTLEPSAGRLLLSGYTVPYTFRITDLPAAAHRDRPPAERPGVLNRNASPYLEYVDFTQNRFPVLDTAENIRYWKDTGMGRVLPRVFPIKLPTYRRVDPLLRELIFFLHAMDPARFSLRKIAERYGLKERTVELIYKEFSVAEFLRRTELATPSTRRLSREKAVLRMKEVIYKLKLGYDQLGDEDLDEQEENEFRGWRSAQDWIHRQQVEVEMMSAFPLPGKRDPLPKRVDVDITVHNTPTMKVMNWIDPNDKVVF